MLLGGFSDHKENLNNQVEIQVITNDVTGSFSQHIRLNMKFNTFL